VNSRDLSELLRRARTPSDVSLAQVRRALDELFTLALTFGDSRSPFGGQIEALQQGIAGTAGDEHLWRRTQQAEERQQRYAALLLVWSRLTPLQQRVLMAQRTPCGSSKRVVQIRSGDLVQWTRRGAEVIGRTRKFDGSTVVAAEDCLFIAETVPVYPKRDEIARQLGIRVQDVARATSEAYQVWREFLADDE
jgi:hypothetical protein